MSSRAAQRAAVDDVAYDAHYFDAELHRDHWFKNNAAKRASRWRDVLRMLEPAVSDRILEIGCGAGLHALKLAPLVGAVVGVDRAHAGVARARHEAARQNAGNASFIAADAAFLPLGCATCDKVAAIDFVEHVGDDVLERVLAEVGRVLRPGGRLAIYTPCGTHYVERLKARNLVLRQIPGHIAVRGPQAYARLLQRAGFAIRSQWFSPSEYPLFGLLDRALGAVPVAGAWFQFRICIVATRVPK